MLQMNWKQDSKLEMLIGLVSIELLIKFIDVVSCCFFVSYKKTFSFFLTTTNNICYFQVSMFDIYFL
jgi:hypothetical protein